MPKIQPLYEDKFNKRYSCILFLAVILIILSFGLVMCHIHLPDVIFVIKKSLFISINHDQSRFFKNSYISGSGLELDTC